MQIAGTTQSGSATKAREPVLLSNNFLILSMTRDIIVEDKSKNRVKALSRLISKAIWQKTKKSRPNKVHSAEQAAKIQKPGYF